MPRLVGFSMAPPAAPAPAPAPALYLNSKSELMPGPGLPRGLDFISWLGLAIEFPEEKRIRTRKRKLMVMVMVHGN
ncbi:hypothetical protein ACLOJK_034157 [Asimina triloba]